MLRQFAPILIPAMIAAIGIAVLIRGLLLPEYTVPDGNEQLFGASWSHTAITWLSFLPAQIFWVSFLDARESPPFIDDMGGPFIAMLTCGFGGIGLPLILFGAWFVMWKKPVPVPIWSPSTAPGFATFAVWIALILAVFVTAGCVVTEPPLVPSCVFTVYLLLCGRAISVSPAQITVARGFEVVLKDPGAG